MAGLRKPPLWALILILIAGSASVAYGAYAVVSNSQNTRESLIFESFNMVSGTNVTLSIRNTGTASVVFTSYVVKDAAGDQYLLNGWEGLIIGPNTQLSVNILIGSSCPNCFLTGSPFTFTPGDAITLTTSRGNPFTFYLS